MTILLTADNEGQTRAGYDGMLAVLGPAIRQAPGFIAHIGHAVDGGWRVIELWDGKRQADAFFVEQVVPRLPRGIHPKRSVLDLHSVVLR